MMRMFTPKKRKKFYPRGQQQSPQVQEPFSTSSKQTQIPTTFSWDGGR